MERQNPRFDRRERGQAVGAGVSRWRSLGAHKYSVFFLFGDGLPVVCREPVAYLERLVGVEGTGQQGVGLLVLLQALAPQALHVEVVGEIGSFLDGLLGVIPPEVFQTELLAACPLPA